MANAEDRRPWIDSEGIVGTGPTYGEHSYNGRPYPEGKLEPGLFDGVEGGGDKLKEKAIGLIHQQYELAAEAKAQGLTSSGSIDPEFSRALTAQHLVEFAQELGILTDEEAEKLKREYWDNRDKTPTKREKK